MTVSQNRYRNNHGYASIVFTIFLVVGLETVIAGSLFNMMRLQREAQRSADEMRISWVAEAAAERAIKLVHDCTKLTGAFPDPDPDSKIVLCGISTAANLTDGKKFDEFLVHWYRNTLKQNPDYESTLSNIDISKVEIKETSRDVVLNTANYLIGVTANKVAGNTTTPFQVTVTQAAAIPINTLFDIAVFCDFDCELMAGPDFTIQGPIFSNGDIYIMNDERDGGANTLTLKLADTFFDPDRPANPEPYLMHAHGDTYFYFKRFVGANYLLGLSNIYFNSVPEYYKFADPDKPAGPDSVKTPEIYPRYGLSYISGAENKYPPYFYYPNNGANCLPVANGDSCDTNQIRVQKKDGTYEWLVHRPDAPLPKMWQAYTTNSADFRLYTPKSEYASSGKMSVSSAFDPSQMSLTEPDHPLVNDPNWSDYMNSTFNNSSTYIVPFLVMDGVPKKDLTIVKPGVLPHVLIEPLTGTPANPIVPPADGVSWDTPDIAQKKLHSQATIVLTKLNGINGIESPDFSRFTERGILREVSDEVSHGVSYPSMYDFRGSGVVLHYELDIAKMMEADRAHEINLGEKPLVYFSFPFPSQAVQVMLRLVNGSKLPKRGLTVATDGRLWIQGDYNIWDYSRRGGKGRECEEREWDDKRCHVPPAAIFSDSFGVLSKEWQGSYSAATLANRKVTSDVMINTALATGYKPSSFTRHSSYYQGVPGMPETRCTDSGIESGNCLSTTSGGLSITPGNDGNLLRYWDPIYTFRCPDGSYTSGKNDVTDSCEYYREASDKYHYYVNPRSTYTDSNGVKQGYQIWMNKPLAALPKCDPAATDENVANHCNHVRIPIFADPDTINHSEREAVPPLPGVSFTILNRALLSGKGWFCTTPQSDCANGRASWQSCPIVSVGEDTDPNGYVYRCPGCGASPRSTCASWELVEVPSRISYFGREYFPLYKASYSGGIENLINLQENWEGKTLRFLGTLSVTWEAKNWIQDFRTDIYRAPRRLFDYNEDLRVRRPPGTPDLSSVKRRRWSRRFD
jgi:hypothetical protein